MTVKMTDRELIRLALLDAMAWRDSVADASGADSEGGKAAMLRSSQFLDYYRRKYGERPAGAARFRLAELAAIRAKKQN